MRAQADGLVYAADGTPVLCEKHGGAFHPYEVICTLNGEPCPCWSADEERGEVWVYTTDEDLQAVTAYEVLRGEDYDLRKGVIGFVFGNPYAILKRLRGDVKLHLTCVTCAASAAQ